ncbi:MAG: helix-turn-helix transcriptional regulator [Cyclobacteriaceae bacterium]|nr:helix-turn-helix transcriptional regulator [Cyclobacteriaceae bacterium]
MSKLKILREVNNYTQEFIAEALGLDQSTYSKLERNPKKLKAEQAEKLAEIYEVSIGDLLSSEGMTIHFSGHIEKNGYVNNSYEVQNEFADKIAAIKDGEIRTLKEQIEHLKSQNEKLMKMLESKL